MSCVSAVHSHMHNCSYMTAGSVCNSQFFHQFFISCCHSNAIYFRSNTVATDFFNLCDTTSVNIFSIGFLQTLADRMRRRTLCKGCVFQKFCILQLIMVYSAYFKHTLCHSTGFIKYHIFCLRQGFQIVRPLNQNTCFTCTTDACKET